MERAETIDYSLSRKCRRWRVQNLWIQRVRQLHLSELLASPIYSRKLSEEERCARISTVTKKKDLAQNLYNAYAAALMSLFSQRW
ncbi:hypothetical protein CEXT_130471 [Caerostris extrusa]|uniref:Ribosomal protein S14 n=1 Tax=Caerostris extrusa TaxID=172846 RepID=A0AAV4N6Q3_CAEEX|nr:hypothetical protein CEXT_130471 [Caerostris extrusa]